MTTTPLRIRPPLSGDARTARVIAFYESLTPETLPSLDTFYADDARFIDPFNDVTGLAAIRRVFDHMFSTLESVTFEVTGSATEGDQSFLIWDFHLRRRAGGAAMTIHGTSHLRFATDGRIAWHRDYWDPAREIYEGLPALGAVLRWIRGRLSAGV